MLCFLHQPLPSRIYGHCVRPRPHTLAAIRILAHLLLALSRQTPPPYPAPCAGRVTAPVPRIQRRSLQILARLRGRHSAHTKPRQQARDTQTRQKPYQSTQSTLVVVICMLSLFRLPMAEAASSACITQILEFLVRSLAISPAFHSRLRSRFGSLS